MTRMTNYMSSLTSSNIPRTRIIIELIVNYVGVNRRKATVDFVLQLNYYYYYFYVYLTPIKD